MNGSKPHWANSPGWPPATSPVCPDCRAHEGEATAQRLKRFAFDLNRGGFP